MKTSRQLAPDLRCHPAETAEFIAPPLEDGIVAPVSWFTDSFAQRYKSYRPRIHFDPHGKSDRCDAYRVSPGMVMLIVDGDRTRSLERRRSSQDIVEFHYRRSGSVTRTGTWGEIQVHGASYLIWHHPDGCDDIVEQSGRTETARDTWVSLYCDRAWLCEHTGRYAIQLLDSLAKDGPDSPAAPHFRLQPQCSLTAHIVDELLLTRVGSALDWLYCIAKATELLYVTLKVTRRPESLDSVARRVSENDQRLLQETRELLASQFAHPPRLSVIARRAGMNSKKLCVLFKYRFGESVFDFVRRQRLEHARHLLMSSGLQVSQVAAAVGYRHHSTFTAAFTRHFGAAPRRVQYGGSAP
jgi:AraC-like DNA-binding protein